MNKLVGRGGSPQACQGLFNTLVQATFPSHVRVDPAHPCSAHISCTKGPLKGPSLGSTTTRAAPQRDVARVKAPSLHPQRHHEASHASATAAHSFVTLGYMDIRTPISTYIYIYTHMHVSMHMHTYIYMYIYIYMMVGH